MPILQRRKATEADLRFVHSSFFTSYWKTHAKKRVERDVYKTYMDKYIDRLLVYADVLVAFTDEVPDEVLGYSIITGPTLHWCYVKGYARRQGIGSGLVTPLATYYSHDTDAVGRKFAQSVGLKFNPFPR